MLDSVAGVVLAGGLARRMGGGDKCLLTLGDKTLLDCVLERAKPQVSRLLLNANGDNARFARFQLPVASDVIADYAGPLAGVLTGMEWARKNHPAIRWLVSFAGDTPFFPCDLVSRFLEQAERDDAQLVCARSAGRTHPVFGLWSLELAGALRTAMMEEGVRKIDQWTARYNCTHVDYPVEAYDPFYNINRPEDLVAARQRLLASRANR